MILVFNPERLPRTMTKSEWQECWRWKRIVEKKLKKTLEEQIALLTVHKDMPSHIRADIINVAVNPPILLVPSYFGDVGVDLRPGSINYVH